MPESWYDDPEIAKRACSTIPLYDGRSVEVGPRARMDVYQGFKDKGVVAQHVARALEMKSALSRAIDILGELDTSAPVMADYVIKGTTKLGVGAIEAHVEWMYTWLKLLMVKSSSTVLWYQPLGTSLLWDQQPKDSTTNLDLMLSELTIHVCPVQLT
jgi:hypothetical protein